jgi:hypothetical protein
MKLAASCTLLCAGILHAAPLLTVGVPAHTAAGIPLPSPLLAGRYVRFDSEPAGLTINPGTVYRIGYSGITDASVTSTDQLVIRPTSTQSAPNELFANSGNGTADITINPDNNVSAIAFGIADPDPVNLTVNVVTTSGIVPFQIDLRSTEDPTNPGNGYYEFQDNVKDILAVEILQTTAAPSFAGLAIDDVQYAPEPGALGLLLFAGAMFVGKWRRSKSQAAR